MTQDKNDYSHAKLKEYQDRYKNPKFDAKSQQNLATWNELKNLPFPVKLVALPLYFAYDLIRFVMGIVKKIIF